MAQGISAEAALAEVEALALELDTEQVSVEHAAGRRLATDVVVRVDHPGFTNSAMDGYALRAAETPGTLRVVGESRAGAPFAGAVGAGEAVRISTGAQLPDGVDAILRREEAREVDGLVEVPADIAPGLHVRRRGEDLAAGSVLLAAGHHVRPHEVAPLATAGLASVAVRRRPRVALLTTGDELVPPGAPLGPGQIYDSNRPGIAAQLRATGAELLASERIGDDAEHTRATLSRLLGADGRPPDLLVTIGGVSVGRHDHLRPALAAVGVEEVFWGVEIRPGHPLWLGRRGAQRVLGLPGNPVSAAVCLHVFGRPLLGHPEAWERRAALAAAYRSPTTRVELVRCRWCADAIEPLPLQLSHAYSSLAGAELLAWVPEGAGEHPAGTRLRISPLC